MDNTTAGCLPSQQESCLHGQQLCPRKRQSASVPRGGMGLGPPSTELQKHHVPLPRVGSDSRHYRSLLSVPAGGVSLGPQCLRVGWRHSVLQSCSLPTRGGGKSLPLALSWGC